MTQQPHMMPYKTKVNEDDHIIYNIFFKNAYYDLESYKEDWTDNKDYCYIEKLTDDEGEAETFLQLLLKGKVYPVHISELAQDYFR